MKSYREAMGDNIFSILSIVEKVAREFSKIDFVLAPNIIYLNALTSKKQYSKIFSQHVDPVPYGAFTGHIPIEALKMINVDGTLINHSEKKVENRVVGEVIKMANKIGIDVCVCAGDLKKTELLSKMKPTYVAFEPPELIGSGRSVSKMKPDELKKSVKIVIDASEGISVPLCGAGISTREDVELAIEYGARGILVASAFVKSNNKEQLLRDFSEAIEKKI